jgi:Tol biopolymer transport system component
MTAVVLVGCQRNITTTTDSAQPRKLLTPTLFPTETMIDRDSYHLALKLINNQAHYYRVHPDGSDSTLIYYGRLPHAAALSRDGKRFAYYLPNSLSIEGVVSNQVTVLNHELIGSMAGPIVWSPDGSELAMQCSYGQQMTLAVCLFDAQTGQIRTLIGENNTDKTCASSIIFFDDWSPDASTIVYSCTNLPEQGKKQIFSIYTYELATQKSTKVFDSTGQDEIWTIGTSISISPDLKYLLITAGQTDYVLQIYLLDLSTKILTQVTHGSDYDSKASSWRSDGHSFYLYRSCHTGTFCESNLVMDIQGKILFPIQIDGEIIQ